MNLRAIFGLYLAVGATYFAIVLLWAKFREGTTHADDGMKESLAFRIAIPLFVFVMVTVGWPLVMGYQIRDQWFPAKAKVDEPFAVREQDLLQSLTLDQVEARERVHDPLGAVPSEPFGHLHHAWAAFKATLPHDAVLSSFLATRPARYGDGEEHYAGYASVREDRVEQWFIASHISRRPNDEDGRALIRRYARIADVPPLTPIPTTEGDPNDEAGT